MCELFPWSTAEHWQRHTPLKRAIHVDLLERAPLTEAEVRLVLTRYCSRLMYQRSVIAGAMRVDLDGNPTDPVTAAEAQWAAKNVARLERNQEERFAAAREQRQQAARLRRTTEEPRMPAAPRVSANW